MRQRRLIAAALLAVALSPGTFVRTEIVPSTTANLAITPEEDLPDTAEASGFTREGVWHLTGSTLEFGGYSALLVTADETLQAFSDRGKQLTFAAPDTASERDATLLSIWDHGRPGESASDIEAATRDPATGDFWLAFENANSVARFTAAGEFLTSRLPPEWQTWPDNSGAEAMTRLPDGRFLVLPERSPTGLIYPSAPTDEVEATTFAVGIPADYAPTDAAALPDGRVLVLLRKLEFGVPPFSSAIGLADPASLERGDTLDVALLLQLEAILPRENYEALVVGETADDGSVELWLMSDDNLSGFQRTLLARLLWQPGGN
ncbi:esterase-like activity of phytase family protein [Aurantiacibacter hainanensis]|uniref:esterase-like activity of phytase family protein n=1 Tax=Aurantiacibacter hainanensis TaxID=3076114 RepID=UPI0030C6AB8C